MRLPKFIITNPVSFITVFVLFLSLYYTSTIWKFYQKHGKRLSGIRSDRQYYQDKPAGEDANIPTVPRASNNIRHSCTPTQKVVFLKTHKTASSTVASIIERYGYTRNLTFAVCNTFLKFSHVNLFTRQMVKETSNPVPGWKKEDGYDMLTNHARFNKVEMDAVVHNATYVTVLRHPVSQLESAFGYFGLGLPMGFDREHQLEEFMKDPERLFGSKRVGFWQYAKNNQLFDLGFDHQYHDDPDVVTATIDKLNHDFDLVLLTEYFDESLVLLRRLLCWDIRDILYISKGIRSARLRMNMSEDLRSKIVAWNKADMQLYQFFNVSLWKQIRDYGPQFQQDLDEFRTKLREVFEECIDPLKKNKADTREDKYVLRDKAPPFCKDLLMGDVGYTRLIQKMMWDRGILLPNPNA